MRQDSNPGSETDPLLPNAKITFDPTSPLANNSPTELYGLLWVGLSAVLYSIPIVIVRFAVKRFGFPSTASMVLRAGTQFLFAVILLWSVVRISPRDLSLPNQVVLLLRGFFGSTAMASLYTALSYIPAGEVTAVFAFTPIVTMLLSKLLLNESTTLWDIVCAFVGIVGIWLITGPEANSIDDALGVLFVLLSSVSAAMAYVCVRRLGTDVHFMLGVFASGAAGVPIVAGIGGQNAFREIVSNQKGTGIVLLGCLSGFLGQCCTNKGFQICNPGVGVIMMSLQIPFVYLLSLWLLDEKPSWLGIAGSILVICAVVMVGVRRFMQN